MEKTDIKIIIIIVCLYVVSTVLQLGPLRTQIEMDLVLMIVPGLPELIEIMKIISETQAGSLEFYGSLIRIIVMSYIHIRILGYLKEKFPSVTKLVKAFECNVLTLDSSKY